MESALQQQCEILYIFIIYLTESLMKQFIEAKKLDSSTVVFHFDGEVINKTDTASSLDMDDGDCIDVTGYD